MELKSVDAALLQKAVLAAAKGLEAKKEWINELNVFPVPDGDTGTNMTMTIMAAAREVAAAQEEPGDVTEFGRKNRRKARKKPKHKKLFAKSVTQ